MPKSSPASKSLQDLLPKSNVDVPVDTDYAKVRAKLEEVARKDSARGAFRVPDNVIKMPSQVAGDPAKEVELLERTLWEQQRKLGKMDFAHFVKEIVFGDMDPDKGKPIWEVHYGSDLHEQMMQEVQELQAGDSLWFFIPREHRKSMILTVLHTLWLIINDPDIRVLIVGARRETCLGLMSVIQSAFTKGAPGFARFQAFFPEFVHEKKPGGAFSFKHKLRTQPLADPTVRVTYLSVAGASWRCDVLKFDDPIERRHVRRPELAVQAGQSMLDLLPLLATTSKYKIITGAGTRWAYFDPYSNIIGETHDETDAELSLKMRDKLLTGKKKIIVRHGFEDPDELCTHCPPHIVERYPHGNPTMQGGDPCGAPVIGTDLLLERYDQYMDNPELGESLYWHQYMNVCKAPSDTKIQEDWMFQLGMPTFPYVRKRVLAIDSADKDLQSPGTGDYMVAMMGDFSEDGRLCVRHVIRSRSFTRDQFQDAILAWCQTVGWWPTLVVKEKVSNDSFLSDMRRRFNAAYHPVAIVAVSRPRDKGKHDFILDVLQAPMERGEIVWGSLVPPQLYQRATYELTNLAMTKNDDVADTLVLLMLPNVRVMAIAKPFARPSQVETPNLDSYRDQGASPPPTMPLSDFQQATHGERFVTAVLDMGPSQVSFNPPVTPDLSSYGKGVRFTP